MIIKPEECLGEIDISFIYLCRCLILVPIEHVEHRKLGSHPLIQYIMACSVEKHAQL